jgi:hypothetical protein
MNQLASRVTPVLTLALSLARRRVRRARPRPGRPRPNGRIGRGYQLVVATADDHTARRAGPGRFAPRVPVILGRAGSRPSTTPGAYLEGTATAMVPSFDGRTWLVNGRNLAGVGSWQLRARAVVRRRAQGLPGPHRHHQRRQRPDQAARAGPARPARSPPARGVRDRRQHRRVGRGRGHVLLAVVGRSRLVDERAAPFASRSRGRCAGGWCASPDGAVAGYQVHTTESALVAGADEQVIGACPGQAMIGAGLGVCSTTPTPSSPAGPPAHEVDYRGRSWLTNAQNHSSFAPRWRLQQRALCAN